MEPDPEVVRIAARVTQLELTLLELVTALGMLVGELALRDDLVLSTPRAVEEALEHGWQALVGVPPSDRAWSDPAQLSLRAPEALEQAMAETGASVGAIYAIDDDYAELLASAGYPDGVIEPFRLFPLAADLPVATAARSGLPLWFGERAELVDSYPHLLEAHEQTETALGEPAVQGAVVPILAGGRVAAVVIVGFTISAASPERARLDAVRERIVGALTARDGS